MEGLVRFSFYLFAAGSMAAIAAAIMYIIYSVGHVRIHRANVATSTGDNVSTSSIHAEEGPVGYARWGTMLTIFGALFFGLSVLTRWRAAGHFPLSNMYEYSMLFVSFVCVMHLIFERAYKVRQLGAIVMTVAALMSV